MKNRIFHQKNRFCPITKDGVLVTLPVDQFPVKDFNLNQFGWPKSDLTMLMEYSKNNVDLDKFNAFAQRIHMLKAEPKNNKTVEQLIHEWRPAWIQTVSEEQSYAEWYYKEFESKLENKDVNPDVEPVEPSADE